MNQPQGLAGVRCGEGFMPWHAERSEAGEVA